MSKLITIITSTFNIGPEFNLTAESIRSQEGGDCQWIVIDAESQLESLAIINANKDVIDYYISEKDSGIYDAWNKACEKILGEWVIFFGAGDSFYSPKTINLLREVLDVSKHKIYYGKVNVVDENMNVICCRGKTENIGWYRGKPNMPCHQGVFQHRTLFSGNKTFDIGYKIAGDTKFLIGTNELENIGYLDLVVSNMLEQGISGRPESKLMILREARMLEKDFGFKTNCLERYSYNLRIYTFYAMMKIFPKNIYSFFAKIRRKFTGS